MIVNITTRERTSAKKGVYVQFILLYGEGKRLRRQKVIKNCWYSVNASEAEKDRMATGYLPSTTSMIPCVSRNVLLEEQIKV